MSDGTPHRDGWVARPFSDLAAGDEIWGALTITEGHVVTAAGIFNDPGPNHVNAQQAAAGRFGERIAHGPLLIGVAIGALGNALGSTIVAMLEQSSRFRRPVRLGDTAITRWTVVQTIAKPAFDGGGIVVFAGETRNGDGELLIELETKLAVAEQALWAPWDGWPDDGPNEVDGSDQ